MNNNITYPQELGDFHQDIKLNEDVRTADLTPPYSDKHTYSKHEYLLKVLPKIYGEELKNKTALSVACNAGAHLFVCQQAGIKSGYGFDVRDIWINQANWIKQNTSYNTDNLTFGCHGIQDLPRDKSYDISFFDGIFYHLANPFADLEKIASITNELITINTAFYNSSDEMPPCLVYKKEGKDISEGLSGVEGTSWLPNDERVLKFLLKDLGFVEFKLIFKNIQENGRGRLCLFASKVPGLLKPQASTITQNISSNP